MGVAVSSTGEVYIPDTYNNRIRVVYNNGTIDTFAGNGNAGYYGDDGPAKLFCPFGVAISTVGSVYIADSYNYRVRLISNSGINTPFTGNGT